jgi:glutamate synthase (NADPH/NADH) large chain
MGLSGSINEILDSLPSRPVKFPKDYYNETKSTQAKKILDNFRVEIRNFWTVRPKDMKGPLQIAEGE